MGTAYLLIGVLLICNIAASIAALRANMFSPLQRTLQLGLVWLLPFFGAGICAAFVASQATIPEAPTTMEPNPGSDGGYPETSVPGICGCSGATDGGDGGGSD